MKEPQLGELNAGDELQRQLKQQLGMTATLQEVLYDAGIVDASGAPIPRDDLKAGFAHPEACTCHRCNRCRNGDYHKVKTCLRPGHLCPLRTKPKE
jgi:hypothetical protein